MPRTRKTEKVPKGKKAKRDAPKESVTELSKEDTTTQAVESNTNESVVESEPTELGETNELVDSVDTPTRKKRTVPTKEIVMEGFDTVISFIENEIESLRNASSKTKGVRFLRSLRKKLTTLRSQSQRVMKKGTRTGTKKNNSNSGFLKKVRISEEMAKFTGWNPEEKKSRVDVTKFICDYIKQKDLQNPDDRRQIMVDNDRKLKKLLQYDSKSANGPLTYFRLQTCMKDHFLKDEPEK